MASTARDYAWFAGVGHGLTVESCLTLIKGLTSEEVVRRIGGDEFAQMTGLEDLHVHQDRVEDQAEVRAFALAEHLTGVRFTRETLNDGLFRCMSQPEPNSL